MKTAFTLSVFASLASGHSLTAWNQEYDYKLVNDQIKLSTDIGYKITAGWRNPLKWGRKEAFYEVV